MTESQRMPEEEALEGSLHAYLKALSDKPVTPRNLVELERATKLARQMLSVGKMQVAATGGFETGGNYIIGESLQQGTNVGYDAYGPSIVQQSSPAETFGASIMREFVASVGQLLKPAAPPEPSLPIPWSPAQMSGADLVYAIAMAREKGMADLEKKLTENLLAMADQVTDAPISSKEEDFCRRCNQPRDKHQQEYDGLACHDAQNHRDLSLEEGAL